MRFFAIVVLITNLLPSVIEASGRCESSVKARECPVCDDGSVVTDCLIDCPGFPSTDTDGDCIDRKLFSQEFLWRDILTMFVWLLTAGVATAAGVGGGGIYVPIGILLLAFAPKQSSGLSQASIFGASLGGLILNFRNQHPKSDMIHDAPGVTATTDTDDKESSESQRKIHRSDLLREDPNATTYSRPLIHFDMALFLSPMEMAGAVLGVLVQKLLPNWLYLLLAALVLAITAYKTIGKYRSTRAKESSREEAAKNESHKEGQISGTEDKQDSAEALATNEEAPSDEHLAKRQAFLVTDSRQIPLEKVAALILLWIGLLVLTLLKGGKGVESLVGITCESPWYSVLLGCQFLWMLGFALVFGFKLLRDQRERQKVSYPFLDDDVVWDMKSLRFYGAFTFVAGIVAGLIGIGGGMVLGPLMLVMGINPRVSTATTATMVVLTSSSVAVIFVTSGIVPWQYAALFFSICLFGSILGKSKIDGYVKKTGRPSLLILILAVIIALATAGCLVILLLKLNESDWCFEGFNEFCPAGSTNSGGCTSNRMLSALDIQVPEFMKL